MYHLGLSVVDATDAAIGCRAAATTITTNSPGPVDNVTEV